MADIEARKKDVLRALEELEAEILVLSQRIAEAKEDLEFVTDEKTLEIYAESHELEEGLTHIELF